VLGSDQDYSKFKDPHSNSEGCTIFLIFVTLFFGFVTFDLLLLIIALGFSATAFSIVHLARVMRTQER
jgi:hypothetical protein